MNRDISLGQRVRERRQSLDMTQEELARALGVTAQHISLLETDRRAPSLALLARLADQLGVTIDYLVTGKERLVPDAITAIEADPTLPPATKRALITIIKRLKG